MLSLVCPIQQQLSDMQTVVEVADKRWESQVEKQSY